MPTSDGKSIQLPLVFLGIVYVSSIIFFHFVEGWSFLDSAYFTTTTLSTVGYGDLVPHSALGKLGVIVLILSGVSTALYVLTHLGGPIRERTIDPYVQKRLEVLRSLTALQTGPVEKSQLKKIKEKMQERQKSDSEGKSQGFGKL